MPDAEESYVISADPESLRKFFPGNSAMARQIREFHWSATPLGPVEKWPASLISTLSICLSARFPMAIYWGREGFLLYNDAWQPILGDKHPWALGLSARQVWPEIWDVIAPLLESVLTTGEATWHSDGLLPMKRFGYTEECYFDYTFNPIRGQNGDIEGILNVVQETTYRVLNERRTRLLRELASRCASAKSEKESCELAISAMGTDIADIPFALVYCVESDKRSARLVETMGLPDESPARPHLIELDDVAADRTWPLAVAFRSERPILVDDLQQRFGTLRGNLWPEPIVQALALPIAVAGEKTIGSVLVVGVNPRHPLDDEYRHFFETVAAHIATAIANARAYEIERKRVEAFAQIDRAKTVFFSNVSHEFRTPLTLILGPTEELLSDAVGATTEIQRAHLLTLRHNAIRLQKLVNTLLDYARIEAGRVEATYEPVDIGLLTRELASTFCSAVHRARLLYIVNCPSIDEPVYIDRDMWEKIVLNLLSNALKFTFNGAIEVSIKSLGNGITLAVRDTGVGIPDDQLPHLSDRFHRVPGSRARTQEGSGIGLALVQELVKLHGGSMQVESAVDSGTTFTIFIPMGSAHLPNERLSAPRTLSSTALGASPFVEEALRWLPDGDDGETLPLPIGASAIIDTPRSSSARSERILIADDNLEMRNYLKRLLETHWNVTVVADGAKALEIARAQRPDLVLSDVMMPELDGFELLRKLRGDKQTNTIPVILLSARAGEESYIEGMNAGADDYIVKPFGARELIARVRALLEIARIRRESEQRFGTMANSSPIMIWMTDTTGHTSFLNSTYLEYFGLAAEEAAVFDFSAIVHPDDREAYEAAFQTALQKRQTFHQRARLRRHDGQWRWFESRGNPILDDGGNMVGFIGSSPDITEIYQSQQALKELGRRKDEFLATLSHELRNPLAPIRNAVEILKSVRPGESEFEWCRDLIDQQVGHMARLMEDLLDLSRITRNTLELRKQPTDLSAVIHDAIETSRPLIDAGQHQLTVELPNKQMRLDGDPTRLLQLFANLLNNAAKYMEPKGKIHLSAKLTPRAALPAAQEVNVSIRDTGIGIAPELLPQLFDMFFQAENGKERRYGGLGIGLTLARSIVELHGGSLEVFSDGHGKGSEFIVRLPLAQDALKSERDGLARGNAGNSHKLSSRVLVVDDNRNQVESIAMLLRIIGCDIRTAYDGPGALEVLKDFHPEFALIDIGLPGIDGFELARRIRTVDTFKNTVLIAQTGWGREEDRQESRAAGFDHHLIKPVDFVLLEKILTGKTGRDLT